MILWCSVNVGRGVGEWGCGGVMVVLMLLVRMVLFVAVRVFKLVSSRGGPGSIMWDVCWTQ
jgi:hypothetical protein